MVSRIFSIGTYVISGAILLVVGAFFLLPRIPGFHDHEVKIVKSGSMEPTIMTGGIVFIQEHEAYRVGDIITFTSRTADIPTTHRIIGTETDQNGVVTFVTKGDANEERDTEVVYPKNIIGAVKFSLPYVGYLLDFARKPVGFALLIGLPALLIIIDEVEKIWVSYRDMKKKRDETDEVEVVVSRDVSQTDTRTLPLTMHLPHQLTPRRVRMHDMVVPSRTEKDFSHEERVTQIRPREIGRYTPRALIVLVMFGTVALLHPFGGTVAFYRNQETSRDNMLEAGAIDFHLKSDGSAFDFLQGSLGDSDGALMMLPTPTKESAGLRYDVSVEFATGSPLVCDSVQVRTSGPFVYFGVLTGLWAEDVLIDTALIMELSLGAGGYTPGDICIVDVVYRGWDQTKGEPSGYTDEERRTLTFTTGTSSILLDMPKEPPVAEPPVPPVLFDEGGALMPLPLPPTPPDDGASLVPSPKDEEIPTSTDVPQETEEVPSGVEDETIPPSDDTTEEGTSDVTDETEDAPTSADAEAEHEEAVSESTEGDSGGGGDSAGGDELS